MQILLACAKTMHDALSSPLPLTIPAFQECADNFACDMMRYDAGKIAEMLSCSQKIAAQTRLRFMRFLDADTAKMPAILAYHGQAYKHLKAETLNQESMQYAQSHLWITSFLYGLLRPLDAIRPYRMEGKVTLPAGGDKSMFDFWKPLLTNMLIDSVKSDDGILLHLATEEFQHLFDWQRIRKEVHVIHPFFYVRKNGHLKIQAVWAKTCRGAMTRYIIENRTATIEQLHNFCYEGFEYTPYIGEADFPHFICEK